MAIQFETDHYRLSVVYGDSTDKPKNRSKRKEHVFLKPPGHLFCAHCGEIYNVVMPVSMTIFSAIVKAFEKDHKKCKVDKQKGLACHLCYNFGHVPDACPRLEYDGDPFLWYQGPDTGLSSKTIHWQLVKGHVHPEPIGVPKDADDFGRCYRLLRAIPGWRVRIGEMAQVEGWEKLTASWDELEKLYEEELPGHRFVKFHEKLETVLKATTDALHEPG